MKEDELILGVFECLDDVFRFVAFVAEDSTRVCFATVDDRDTPTIWIDMSSRDDLLLRYYNTWFSLDDNTHRGGSPFRKRLLGCVRLMAKVIGSEYLVEIAHLTFVTCTEFYKASLFVKDEGTLLATVEDGHMSVVELERRLVHE